LALAFFPEERFVIRQWQFQLGTLLGLIGAFGVIWFQANPQARTPSGHIALPGLFIAFTATFCWALYGVLIKRPSAQLGSIRSFGIVSFITSTLLFAPHARVWQNRHAHPRGLAGEPRSYHFRCDLYHACPCFVLRRDPRNRSCPSTNAPASLPAIAMALSAWIYHERLTHAQVWSAAICWPAPFWRCARSRSP